MSIDPEAEKGNKSRRKPKSMTMKMTTICSLLLLIFVTSCKQKQEGIFAITTEQGSAEKFKGPEVMNSVNLKINMEKLIAEQTGILELPLAEGKSLRLIKKREDKFEKGRSAWFGIIDGDPGSFVLLSLNKTAMAGKITTGKGQTYSIRYMGKGIHRLAEIDGTKFNETIDDAVRIKSEGGNTGGVADCPDPSTRIDVMVVYTADALAEAGDADGMEAFIYECIYFSNLAYQNSNINHRVNLVHFEQVTYTEAANSSTDLNRLSNGADGFMDNVQTLRDTYGADLVVLLTHTLESGICGRGYMPSPPTAATDTKGFSVVKMSCAVDNLSFPHEMGHNMGADHLCGDGASANINHGYLVSEPADGGNSWRTVLAYNQCTSGTCTRIPYFSNPGLSYSPTGSATTDPMGTVAAVGTCTADNHSTLNTYSSIIANYRCGSPGVNNVWMRDTWEDSGLEPDPATAGQAMYRSPYIWIRNAQDPTFLHQHEHQNPEFGQPNWVYVKMHNGGVAATGNLEVYFANASVSLSWPASWTLLASTPVTIGASDSRVIEIPWNSLPGTGHYCMIARWVSAADPMHTAETTDINANTRQNNNIVWRNLNIVDLLADEADEEFRVMSLGRTPFSIELNDDALFPKHAFTETGKITIKLDERLYAAWKKGGAKGTGIKANGNTIEVNAPNATLDNITVADNKEPMKGIVHFSKNKNTLPDFYSFTVQQTTADEKKGSKTVIGGVTYDINATLRK